MWWGHQSMTLWDLSVCLSWPLLLLLLLRLLLLSSSSLPQQSTMPPLYWPPVHLSTCRARYQLHIAVPSLPTTGELGQKEVSRD